MLTTEVVKGLLAGKVYSRFTASDNRLTIKIHDKVVMMKLGGFPWREMIFDLLDLEGDWKEVTEWQEIDWKEAVDCHNEGIPLQWNSFGEWVDSKTYLNSETVGFVCHVKWRKKVEVNGNGKEAS